MSDGRKTLGDIAAEAKGAQEVLDDAGFRDAYRVLKDTVTPAARGYGRGKAVHIAILNYTKGVTGYDTEKTHGAAVHHAIMTGTRHKAAEDSVSHLSITDAGIALAALLKTIRCKACSCEMFKSSDPHAAIFKPWGVKGAGVEAAFLSRRRVGKEFSKKMAFTVDLKTGDVVWDEAFREECMLWVPVLCPLRFQMSGRVDVQFIGIRLVIEGDVTPSAVFTRPVGCTRFNSNHGVLHDMGDPKGLERLYSHYSGTLSPSSKVMITLQKEILQHHRKYGKDSKHELEQWYVAPGDVDWTKRVLAEQLWGQTKPGTGKSAGAEDGDKARAKALASHISGLVGHSFMEPPNTFAKTVNDSMCGMFAIGRVRSVVEECRKQGMGEDTCASTALLVQLARKGMMAFESFKAKGESSAAEVLKNLTPAQSEALRDLQKATRDSFLVPLPAPGPEFHVGHEDSLLWGGPDGASPGSVSTSFTWFMRIPESALAPGVHRPTGHRFSAFRYKVCVRLVPLYLQTALEDKFRSVVRHRETTLPGEVFPPGTIVVDNNREMLKAAFGKAVASVSFDVDTFVMNVIVAAAGTGALTGVVGRLFRLGPNVGRTFREKEKGGFGGDFEARASSGFDEVGLPLHWSSPGMQMLDTVPSPALRANTSHHLEDPAVRDRIDTFYDNRADDDITILDSLLGLPGAFPVPTPVPPPTPPQPIPVFRPRNRGKFIPPTRPSPGDDDDDDGDDGDDDCAGDDDGAGDEDGDGDGYFVSPHHKRRRTVYRGGMKGKAAAMYRSQKRVETSVLNSTTTTTMPVAPPSQTPPEPSPRDKHLDSMLNYREPKDVLVQVHPSTRTFRMIHGLVVFNLDCSPMKLRSMALFEVQNPNATIIHNQLTLAQRGSRIHDCDVRPDATGVTPDNQHTRWPTKILSWHGTRVESAVGICTSCRGSSFKSALSESRLNSKASFLGSGTYTSSALYYSTHQAFGRPDENGTTTVMLCETIIAGASKEINVCNPTAPMLVAADPIMVRPVFLVRMKLVDSRHTT